ncbi:hypothetical protein RISK_005193 [Rhodopirellula islandica]|uniref:Uncharacterized protein n=1 Tax=Rhodopirellula islandica TaxID=595434 RepID=A0A0J1B862_RHOIS|nr:hypothetical protein RISK_005193 [Rhodopirellula islandica]
MESVNSRRRRSREFRWWVAAIRSRVSVHVSCLTFVACKTFAGGVSRPTNAL